MTKWSILSVKFMLVVLVFLKTMYLDFFKFNDSLFIFSHSFTLASSLFILFSASLIALFWRGDSMLL